jgi:hypothetical protein
MQLVVGIRSFFSLLDGGTKSWQQGKMLPTQIVDTHNYGLMQLVDFIAEHYMWGSKQMISLFRELDNDSIEIKSDEQLHEWFELNAEKGVVRITAQINDFEGPLQCSPTKRRCHPSIRNRATNETATNVRAKSTSKKKRDTYESVPSDSSYDTDLAASSESDPEYDPDGEIVDDHDEFDPPPFSYDVDNPCIDVGVVFPDVDQCKSAVTHYSILHDHAFEIVKKDQTRFRAKCMSADMGCEWKFFASTSKKYIGCKVISVFCGYLL